MYSCIPPYTAVHHSQVIGGDGWRRSKWPICSPILVKWTPLAFLDCIWTGNRHEHAGGDECTGQTCHNCTSRRATVRYVGLLETVIAILTLYEKRSLIRYFYLLHQVLGNYCCMHHWALQLRQFLANRLRGVCNSVSHHEWYQ